MDLIRQLLWTSCIVSVSISLLMSTAIAEVDGDLSLLKRLAALQSENLSRLRQWSGSADLHFREQRTEGNYECVQRAQARFSHDFDRDAICFSWEIVESFARLDGQEDLVDSLKGARAGALHLDDEQFKMPLTMPQHPYTVQVFTRTEPHVGDFTQAFYPLTYFRVQSTSAEEFLTTLINVAERDWALVQIKRDGQLVTLVTRNKTLPGSTRTVFDLAQAGCLVELKRDHGASSGISGTRLNEYLFEDGVFVPTKVVYKQVHYSNSEISEIHEKTVEFTQQAVNQPIPDSDFTLEAMGVPAGATIVDRRLMTTYQYQPEEASLGHAAPVSNQSPAVNDVNATSPTSAGGAGSLYLQITLISLAVMICAFGFWWHAKRGRQNET